MAARRTQGDGVDAALGRLRQALDASGAAVARSRETPAHRQQRVRQFGQARSGFGDPRVKAPPVARPLPLQGAARIDRIGQMRDAWLDPWRDKGTDEDWNRVEGLAGRLEYDALRNPAYGDAALHGFDFGQLLRGARPQGVKGVNAALRGIVAAVKGGWIKQSPGAIPGAPLYGTQPNIPALQATLRRNLAGTPGYASTPPISAARQTGRSLPPGLGGGGIEPTPRNSGVSVGTSAPTALNWARTENKEQLRNLLGRRPTQEEIRAGMQVRRQLARDAGQPFVAINPDNRPPSFGPGGEQANWGTEDRIHLRYPNTMTNPQLRYYYPEVREELSWDLERPPTPVEVRAAYRKKAANNLTWYGQHAINPNAQIRDPRVLDYANEENYRPGLDADKEHLRIDPRLPERYNRTLPPERRMTQQQMDAIRLQYYQANPSLVPVYGQPGYDAWQKHIRRAQGYGTGGG